MELLILFNPLFPFTAPSRAYSNTSTILDTWKIVYATASNWTIKLQKGKYNPRENLDDAQAQNFVTDWPQLSHVLENKNTTT